MAAVATPVLSGAPAATVAAAQYYTFQPAVADAGGAALTFLINNKPAWAQFDSTTGRLYGMPPAASVGTYSGISISASDGVGRAYLAPFSIAVLAAASAPIHMGSATISWLPPLQNTNGAALTNLAGYNIYYGTSPNNLAQKVSVANPGITRYLIGGLLSGNTWYFQLTAYNTGGIESARTAVESLVMP